MNNANALSFAEALEELVPNKLMKLILVSNYLDDESIS